MWPEIFVSNNSRLPCKRRVLGVWFHSYPANHSGYPLGALSEGTGICASHGETGRTFGGRAGFIDEVFYRHEKRKTFTLDAGSG